MSLLKTKKPAASWISQKKTVCVVYVHPPRSWIAFVKTHNKKGKLIQIAAQLCGPVFCFSILHLPKCTKGHLCTWTPNHFYRFPVPYPLIFSKECKWVTPEHTVGIGTDFTIVGPLGKMYYCNISKLHYTQLSLWLSHSPSLTISLTLRFL